MGHNKNSSSKSSTERSQLLTPRQMLGWLSHSHPCGSHKEQENLGFTLSKEFLQGIFILGSLKPKYLIYPSSQPSERNILLSFVNNLMHFKPLFWWLGPKLRIDLTGKLSS